MARHNHDAWNEIRQLTTRKGHIFARRRKNILERLFHLGRLTRTESDTPGHTSQKFDEQFVITQYFTAWLILRIIRDEESQP